jgi:hypothetical protein
MKTARLTVLPACDFGCGETARYDAATFLGPWAYMCQSCFKVNGTGELGLGKGQRLELEEGVESEVIGHA